MNSAIGRWENLFLSGKGGRNVKEVMSSILALKNRQDGEHTVFLAKMVKINSKDPCGLCPEEENKGVWQSVARRWGMTRCAEQPLLIPPFSRPRVRPGRSGQDKGLASRGF